MDPQHPVFTVEPPGVPPPRRPTSAPRRGIAGLLTAAAVLALKFGKTFLSMGVMIWAYSFFYGWKFAAGFVGLIFVHEMGHVFAAMALGIPVTAPIFIPFFGAAIVMRKNPRDALTEAMMAYAGPLAGGVGSWICMWVAQETDRPWLLAVAAFSFGINLFNLIPVPPLDGGRVCAAVSRWFWVLGVLLLVGAMIYFHAWLFLLIGTLVLVMGYRRIRDDLRYREQMRQYYQLSLGMRVLVAAFYLALIGVLVVGLAEASSSMPSVSTATSNWDSGQ
jgi:Zn-dependent protease